MQILGFDFLFASALDPVEDPKLWHVEQALEPIEFNALEGIHTEVNFSEQGKIFDVAQLVNLANIVEAHIQKFETFNLLQSPETRDVILRKIKSSQSWQHIESLDCCELICAQVQLFNPEVCEIFDPLNLVTIERQHSQTLVGAQAINLRYIVVV